MKFPARAGSFLVLLTALASAASGAGLETNAPPAFPETSGDLLFVMLRLMGALFLVIAVFLFAVWFFKRSRFFSMYQGASTQLKILESRSVGYRNTLLVVGYCQQRFLLAVSATGVNLLSPLPDILPTEPSAPASSPFAEQLGAIQQRKAP